MTNKKILRNITYIGTRRKIIDDYSERVDLN